MAADDSNTNTTAADDGLTGQIGTALYIAPEISQSSRTSYYTQKVDMYSLGVIFFEMCYNPLQTGMERIKVLTDLRSPSVKFPHDFDAALLMQQGGNSMDFFKVWWIQTLLGQYWVNF